MKVKSMVLFGVSGKGDADSVGYRVLQKLVEDDVDDIYLVDSSEEDVKVITESGKSKYVLCFRKLISAPSTEELAFYVDRRIILRERPSPDRYSRIWVPPREVIDEEGIELEGRIMEHFADLGYNANKILLNNCYLKGRILSG